MKSYFSNDFRVGLKIILKNEPYEIESNEFVKPGKGQAFVRVKLRCLITGCKIEKTFKSIESFKYAEIININLTYLYKDNSFWYFMNKKNFEQIVANEMVIGKNVKWLLSQIDYLATLWNGKLISITPPNFLELKVIKTDPGLKGNTTNNSSKIAILSTGAIVRVPLFVQTGEIIKVDTRSGEYISRVKKF